MQLTGKEAVQRANIAPENPSSTRPASYDLGVGTIVMDGEERKGTVIIQPQQTFIIVSRERVKVPAGLVGYALPKTSLCNEGILVLNTGLIDPGFEGELSTIAINFSRAAYRIKPGESFLRLVFHELKGDQAQEFDHVSRTPQSGTPEDDRKARSQNYPDTFLDVPGQTDRLIRDVTADVVERQRNAIVMLISATAFLFVLWNFGSYFLMSRQASAIAARAPQMESLAKDVGGLMARVQALESVQTKAQPAPQENKKK